MGAGRAGASGRARVRHGRAMRAATMGQSLSLRGPRVAERAIEQALERDELARESAARAFGRAGA